MKVAVIGGGWAGMAAAVRLVQRGAAVTVFEASRTLGGRARRVDVDGTTLDNGQHILLGAYQRCLALMQEVGVGPQSVQRLPLQLRYARGPSFQAASLPAPWNLLWGVLRARGFSWHDKKSLLGFMRQLKRQAWRVAPHSTVQQLTAHLPQALRHFWFDPLCVAALNTPPEEACAQVFANTLRDALDTSRPWSDMLVPTVDLSALFPEAAARYVQSRGGHVKLGCAVSAVVRAGTRFLLPEHPETFDRIIMATPAPRTRDFLMKMHHQNAPLLSLAEQLDAMRFEPISTVYLKPTERLSLSTPMLALESRPEQNDYAQFVFARGDWLACVISAARRAALLSHEELTGAVVAQLRTALQVTFQLENARVITEKRATFLCTPHLQRPDVLTPLPGLLMAGDYVAPPEITQHYPATLEAAVRAGERAANAV